MFLVHLAVIANPKRGSHCVKYSFCTVSTILLLRGVLNFSNNPEGGLPKKMNAIRSGSRFFFVSKAISPPPPSDLNNDRSLNREFEECWKCNKTVFPSINCFSLRCFELPKLRFGKTRLCVQVFSSWRRQHFLILPLVD